MAIQNELLTKFFSMVSPCFLGLRGGRNPQVVNELADCRQATFLKVFSVSATARKWTASQPRGNLPGCPIWLWLCVLRPAWVAVVVAPALDTRRERSQPAAG